MSVISSRVKSADRRPSASRAVRAALALLLVVGLGFVSACGMDAQTLKPYTPAEGINFDVGDSNDANNVVHVRNLLIITRGDGEGIVSASLVCYGSDTLTGVSGAPFKLDGSAGQTFTADLGGRVPLTSGTLEVLTQRTPLITVSSPDLVAGLDANVTLDFGKVGSMTVRVPVVDGNFAPYTNITASPSASSSASASASPSGSATP